MIRVSDPFRSQDRGTTAQDYEFTNQVPGGSHSNSGDSVARASQRWNDIAINGADMHFRRNGDVSNYNPFDPCSLADYRNGIHYRDVPDNPLAVAELCISTRIGTYLINNFEIVYDPLLGTRVLTTPPSDRGSTMSTVRRRTNSVT